MDLSAVIIPIMESINAEIVRTAVVDYYTQDFKLNAEELAIEAINVFEEGYGLGTGTTTELQKAQILTASRLYIQRLKSIYSKSTQAKAFFTTELVPTDSDSIHAIIKAKPGLSVGESTSLFEKVKEKNYPGRLVLFKQCQKIYKTSKGKIEQTFDLGHLGESRVATQANMLALKAIEDALVYRAGFSKNAAEKIMISNLGLDIKIANNKISNVTLQSFYKNRDSVNEKNDALAIRNTLVEGAQKLSKEILPEYASQLAITKLYEEFSSVSGAELKGFKMYKMKSLSKNIKDSKPQKGKKIKTKAAKIKERRARVIKSDNASLFKLRDILNRFITPALATKMPEYPGGLVTGKPLHWRTGDFARSVAVNEMTSTGSQKIGNRVTYKYSYDKKYEVFVPGSPTAAANRGLATRLRNPDKLIKDILAEMMAKHLAKGTKIQPIKEFKA